MEIAGRALNERLQRLLVEQGISLNSSAEMEIVRDIKEKCCYVTQED